MKINVKKVIINVILKTILGMLALVILIPIIWLIFSAFKEEADIISWPPTFFPKEFVFSNWEGVKSKIDIIQYTVNSMIYALGTSIPAVFLNALAGYAFSRFNFKFKNVIFIGYLATLMIPFQVIMVPLYLEIHALGWLNSYAALIVPKIASASWIFLCRAAFDGLPKELEEAARIDGCSEIRIFSNIMLPLIKPTCITIFILTVNGCWNDMLWPMLVANSSSMRTLANGLAILIGTHTTEYGSSFMGALFSMLPMLILYIFGQKYFIEGQAHSGIKG